MGTNIVFNTKSGAKYLANRTVCLPLALVDNCTINDTLTLCIASVVDNYVIQLNISGNNLKRGVVKRSARRTDKKFYVYSY